MELLGARPNLVSRPRWPAPPTARVAIRALLMGTDRMTGRMMQRRIRIRGLVIRMPQGMRWAITRLTR
jgi:hypothetical protein